MTNEWFGRIMTMEKTMLGIKKDGTVNDEQLIDFLSQK